MNSASAAQSLSLPLAGTITGTVTNAQTGATIPGVNVIIKGTTLGAATDANGQYTISGVAPGTYTLIASFIGYTNATREGVVVTDGERVVVDFALEPAALGLDEVVVVGYGTQQKRDLTGSVASVDVEEIQQLPSNQLAESLQGQASGVTIVSSGQPGAEPMINIRGFNTFGDNSPLYIVDGIPTKNISMLNPNNIATMQVLKDAGAASIYGSRASNGVIVITTREGSGDISVSYNSYLGYQVPETNNVWDLLSPQGMADLVWMAKRHSGVELCHPQYGCGEEPTLPTYISPAGAEEVDESNYFVIPHYTDPNVLGNFFYITRANEEGTDWFDEIFDPAPTTSHNLSVSGGGELGNYFLSLGYLNQQGTLMNTYLERYTVRVNTQFNVSDNIRIGENLAYSVESNPTVAALSEGSAIGMSFRERRIIPVYDIRGNFAGTASRGLGNAANPVAIQYRNRNNDGQEQRLFGNVFAEAELGDFLFRSNFGGEILSSYYHSFTYPTYEDAENNTTNAYHEQSADDYSWTWSNTVRYQNVFAEMHDVNVLLGQEMTKNSGRGVGGTTRGYFSFDPTYTNLNTGSGNQTNFSYTYANALFSLFGRLDYSYAGKYLLGATLRYDGSSRFLKNVRWGWFPAVSAGWRLSEEPFMDGLEWLSNLKIRGSWGVMGNQLNVNPNNPYTLFVGDPVDSYYAIRQSNTTTTMGLRQQRIGNPDARWERDKIFNIGFDLGLFGDRIEASVDYYEKNIEGLLFNPELPATAGAASPPFVNVASMTNNGLDVSLSGRANLTEELRLDVGVNFTTYNNTIVNIAEGVDHFDLESRRFIGSPIIRNAEGHPLSSFFGYRIVGFWDTEEEIQQANARAREATGNANATFQDDIALGRFRYDDVNGDGLITPADRTFLGSPNPDFTYGLNLNLAYKNWTLSASLYGVQGNEIWNQVKWYTDFYASFRGAKSKTALYDSWTPQNKDATAPIQEVVGSFSTSGVPNSYYVEDGSYLRAKAIRIGYTLPSTLLERLGVGQAFEIYAQVANAFTITQYSGPDPAVGNNVNDNDVTDFGIDEGQYPSSRTYLIGLSLRF